MRKCTCRSTSAKAAELVSRHAGPAHGGSRARTGPGRIALQWRADEIPYFALFNTSVRGSQQLALKQIYGGSGEVPNGGEPADFAQVPDEVDLLDPHCSNTGRRPYDQNGSSCTG